MGRPSAYVELRATKLIVLELTIEVYKQGISAETCEFYFVTLAVPRNKTQIRQQDIAISVNRLIMLIKVF